MEWRYSKQARKFLNKIDEKSKAKILDAIHNPVSCRKLAKVQEFRGERYGIKIEHFRIILIKTNESNFIATIDTRTNMKKLKYGYF